MKTIELEHGLLNRINEECSLQLCYSARKGDVVRNTSFVNFDELYDIWTLNVFSNHILLILKPGRAENCELPRFANYLVRNGCSMTALTKQFACLYAPNYLYWKHLSPLYTPDEEPLVILPQGIL